MSSFSPRARAAQQMSGTLKSNFTYVDSLRKSNRISRKAAVVSALIWEEEFPEWFRRHGQLCFNSVPPEALTARESVLPNLMATLNPQRLQKSDIEK